MKNKILFSLLFVLTMVYQGIAQRTVTGTVIDDSGEGLPGVNVVIKGTTTGSVTDFNGNYNVQAEDANTLIFSFVGFESQEIAVGSQTTVDVALQIINQLDEVVVTAIGLSVNKRDLGYSIQNVGGDELDRANETNIVAGLASKAAGVQITSSGGTAGAAAQIRIRGNSTIQGSNSPLFIVDGIPIDNSTVNTADSPEGAISNLGTGGVNNSNRAIDLNPSDIQSLTVLKGPAATALYGVRAGNGAIIITTKKGKKGKARITYSYGVTLDRVNKLPGLQTAYAQGNPINGVPTFQGPMTGSFTGFSWGPLISDLRYADEESIWDPNGLIVHNSDPRATGNTAKAYNNSEEFFETGTTTNHYVSASGGTDAVTYYLSLGNLSQRGIVPNSTFGRTSVKTTLTAKLSDKLEATFSANYIRSGGRRVQNGSNTSGVMLGLLRTTPSFDNRGGVDPAKNSSGYQFPGGIPRAYRGQIGGGAIYDNPYWTIYKNFQTDQVNRLISYAYLKYNFSESFNVNGRVGLDTYSDFRKARNDIGSGAIGVGQVINQAIQNNDLNIDLYGSYQKEINDFYFTALLGWNYFDKKVTNRREDGQGLADRGFFNAASASSFSVVERPTAKQLYGLYGEVKLSYKDMLFLNLSGRNDWSSTLGVSDNSFFYPSASAGWVLTESIQVNESILPYAKLRVSYGKVGNDAPFGFTNNSFTQSRVRDGWTTPNGVLFPALGTNSFTPSNTLGNADLRPEFTTTFEIGGDLKFWNSRITADITYYRALTQDAIINVDLPYSSGYAASVINAGELENKGIEAVLTADLVKTSNFSYQTTFIFNQYTSVVNEIAPGLDVITIDPFGTQRIQKGESYGIFYGTKFLRDDQGRMVINQTTGMPLQDSNNGKVGDPNPDFTLGFRNTFYYKNFELSFLLDFRKGGDVYNGTSGVLNNFGVGEATLDRNESVVFPGVAADENGNPTTDINTVSVIKGGTDGNSNYYQEYGFVGIDELAVQDASWVRLRDVNISYALPSSYFSNWPIIKDINISLNARNLFLITKYTGIDPETNLTGDASNVFGYDYFNNPNTKSYGIKLNVTF